MKAFVPALVTMCKGSEKTAAQWERDIANLIGARAFTMKVDLT